VPVVRQEQGGLPQIQDLSNLLQNFGERRKSAGRKKSQLVESNLHASTECNLKTTVYDIRDKKL